MRRFGLIGYPLSHSFSKKFFTGKFAREGLQQCVYENFALPVIDDLMGVLQQHPDLEGFNITIPYKEAVISFLDERSEVVQQTGACNCVRIINGRLHGHNTDVVGFGETLKRKLQSHHRHALVLGTGGAAKAVHFVLQNLGIDFLEVSRTPRFEQTGYDEITPVLLKSFTLIINTTPVGMYPVTDQCPPIPYEHLDPSHYLYDLVYNPPKTLFLQKGEERGAAIENGMDMLEIQAEESWKIWNASL